MHRRLRVVSAVDVVDGFVESRHQAYQTQFAEYCARDDDGEQEYPDQNLDCYQAESLALRGASVSPCVRHAGYLRHSKIFLTWLALSLVPRPKYVIAAEGLHHRRTWVWVRDQLALQGHNAKAEHKNISTFQHHSTLTGCAESNNV